MTSTTTFKNSERRMIDKTRNLAQCALRKAAGSCLGLVMRLLILLFVLAIEYKLLYEVFAWIKTPMPGQSQLFSVGLLALTSAIVVLTAHGIAKNDPDGVLIRIIGTSAAIMVFLWAAGIGGVFGATLWFDGAEQLFSGASNGDLTGSIETFFESAADTSEPGILKTFLEERAFKVLAACFVLGACGLSLCVIWLAHRLIGGIIYRLPSIKTLLESRETLRDLSRIAAIEARLDAIDLERTELKQSLQAAELDAAEAIASELSQAICTCRKLIREREFATNVNAPRFVPQSTGSAADFANEAAVNRCLSDLTAYATTRNIINDIRTHCEGESA